MITKWLHFTEVGGDPWLLPIWSAVNDAVKFGRVSPLPTEASPLAVHLSSRLNILPRIIQRVNAGTSLLLQEVKKHGPEHVFTKNHEGYGYRVDDDLKYSLIADVDALFFELNSACELMTRLFSLLHAHVGTIIPELELGITIAKVLSQGEYDAKWFVSLDRHRNFFMHEGAPYLAVDLSNEPEHLVLLVMKENVRMLSDPNSFITISEINLIVQGFLSAKQSLQDHLCSLFKLKG